MRMGMLPLDKDLICSVIVGTIQLMEELLDMGVLRQFNSAFEPNRTTDAYTAKYMPVSSYFRGHVEARYL